MAINLNEQFQKLKEIALSAQTFVRRVDDGLYTGPINPSAIYVWTYEPKHTLRFVFVLADGVPPEDLGEYWDEESPGGFITAELNGNLEFEDWDPSSKTLIVDGDTSPDGTLWGRCEYLVSKPKIHVSTALLFYEREGIGYTGMLMQKR
jgi:hypothetical protein